MSDSFDDSSSSVSSSGDADGVTETSTEGYGSRLGGSIVAAVIGLILVPAAIVLMYWNVGRAVDAIRALNRGAAAIIEVNITAVDPATNGKLVHLTGMLQPGTPAKDPVFGVSGDGMVRLSRKVEMCPVGGRIALAIVTECRRLEDHDDDLHVQEGMVGVSGQLRQFQARRPSESIDAGAVVNVRWR